MSLLLEVAAQLNAGGRPAAPPAGKSYADFAYDEDHPGWTILTGRRATQLGRGFEDFVINGFRDNAVVRACVQEITTSVSEAPLQAFRRIVKTGQEPQFERAVQSGLEELLENPNDRDPGLGFVERLVQHYLLGGNMVIKKLRAGGPGSMVRALLPVRPDLVYSAVTDADGIPQFYKMRENDTSGRIILVPASDLVLVPDIDPLNEVFGLPRLMAAARKLATDRLSDDYVQEILTNHGTPGLIIGVESGVREGELERAEETLEEKFGPGRGRGKMAVASGAKLIKEIGFNLRDLEMDGVRLVTAERICAVFGVDPRVAGVASATRGSGTLSGAEHKEARLKLWMQTIFPLLRRMRAYLDVQLAYEWGDMRVYADTSEVLALQPDRDAMFERAERMSKMAVYTRPEIREETGHEPEPPDGEPVLGPLSIVERLPGAAQPAGIGGPAEGGDEDEEEDEERALYLRRARKSLPPGTVPEYTLTLVAPRSWKVGTPERDLAWKQWDQFAASWEPTFQQEAMQLLEAWADRLERVTVDTLVEESTRGSGSGLEAKQLTEESVLAWQRAMGLEQDAYHAAWLERFRELTTSVTEVAGAGLAGELGVSFDMFDPILQEFLDARPNLLAGGVSESTFAAIKDSIGLGMRRGEGTGQLAQRVRNVFNQGYVRTLADGTRIQVLSAAQRSRLIGRTEASCVVNGATWATARATKLLLDKEWLTQGDDRVRDSHQAMDGETVPVEDAFSNGSDYPDDVNERCTMLFHTRE